MESGDRILVAAGLTAAVVVGALVLWGPGGAPKTRKRRGQIAGLQNLGRTCFLNTLLQAMAACPSFIAWLRNYSKPDCNTSMITTLYTVIEVVNGTHPTARGTPVCPLGVLQCLRTLGWVITEEQQDAHELLHVILSCLDEEVQAMHKKVGCLTDALVSRGESTPATPLGPRPASAAPPRGDEPALIQDGSSESPPESLSLSRMRYGGVSRSLCSLSGVGMLRPIPAPRRPPPAGPLHGTLATRLQCAVCSHKSPIRYDKFDSVSLSLATCSSSNLASVASLLRAFTNPEIVSDVKCDACHHHTKHIKTLAFGKMPPCLCLHIARLVWSANGLSKRSDFVSFPEQLSLSPFAQTHTPKKEPLSQLNSETGNIRGNLLSAECSVSSATSCNSNYSLCAVVVHVGGPSSGHFITYRRGNGFEAARWWYTSDTAVHEVSLQEVMSCSAYMLFYEKKLSSNRL